MVIVRKHTIFSLKKGELHPDKILGKIRVERDLFLNMGIERDNSGKYRIIKDILQCSKTYHDKSTIFMSIYKMDLKLYCQCKC